MTVPLTPEERQDFLQTHVHWQYDSVRNALFRSVRVTDFSAALALMVRIGIEAEKADHHPEWSNVYNRIDIWLITHACSAVSSRDLELAGKIDKLVMETQRKVG